MYAEKTELPADVIPRDPSALKIPKSLPQQTLEALLRIEALLERLTDDDGPVHDADGKPLDLASVVTEIEPTPTPFMKHAGKKRKGK